MVKVNPTDCTLENEELFAQIDSALAVWNNLPLSGLHLVRSLEDASMTPDEYLAGDSSEVPIIFCDPDFELNTGDSDVVPAATRVGVATTTDQTLNRAAIFLNAEVGAAAEISQLPPAVFQITLAHEVGHMLGLGHSSVPAALMYFNVSNKSSAFAGEDDIQGITFLYPRNEFQRNPFGCARSSQATTGPSALVWGGLYLLFLLGLGRRLRLRQI